MPDDDVNNTATPALLAEETLDLTVENPAPGQYLRPALQWQPAPGFEQPPGFIYQDEAGQPQRAEFTTPSASLKHFWFVAQDELERQPAYYADGCWAIKPEDGPQGGLTLPLHLDAPAPCTLTFEVYLPGDEALCELQQSYAAQADDWDWQRPIVFRLNEGEAQHFEAFPQIISPQTRGFHEVTVTLPLAQLRAGENTVWLGTDHTAFGNLYLKAVTFRRYDAPSPDAPPPTPVRMEKMQAAPEPGSMEGWLECAKQKYAALPFHNDEHSAYALNVEINRVSQLMEAEAARAATGALPAALAAREARLQALLKYLLHLLGIHAAAGQPFRQRAPMAPPPQPHFFKESVIFKQKLLPAKKKSRPKLSVKPSAPPATATLDDVPAVFVEAETLDLSVPAPLATQRLKLVPPDANHPAYYYSDGCWAGEWFAFDLQLAELDQCTLTFELFIPDDPAVRALYRQNPANIGDASDWQLPLMVKVNYHQAFNLSVNPLGRDFIKVTTSFLQRRQLEVGANTVTLTTLPQTIKHLYVRSVTLKRFSVQKQEQSEWCWAAVCASLVSLLAPDAAAQTEVVNTAFAGTQHADDDPNQQFEIERAARKLGLEVLTTDRRLHLYELREGLDMGLPIPLQMNWKQLDAQGQIMRDENGFEIFGSGHYVVLTDIENDFNKPDGQIIVTVEDPSKGTLKMTFDELQEDYPGAANKHLYQTPHVGRWSYTHCIFPALAGTREKKTTAAPALKTWAARVKFARLWEEYHPGKERGLPQRALRAELDHLLAWFRYRVDWRGPFEQKEPSFATAVNRRERDLQAIQQHLLRLLTVQDVLQHADDEPRGTRRARAKPARR